MLLFVIDVIFIDIIYYAIIFIIITDDYASFRLRYY